MMEFKDFTLLSWNIRGAHNNRAKRHIKDLIRKFQPCIFIVIETHITFSRTKAFWYGIGYSPVQVVEAHGHSGGLWVLRNNGSNVIVSTLDVHPHAITFKLELGGRSWVCTGVYASPVPANRPHLWQHLRNLRSTISDPWVHIGDFNEITLPGDQRGGNFNHHRAAAMINMMEACDMVDLPCTGRRFTWHHRCRSNTYVAKKLDRGLADMTWQWAFQDAYVEVLQRLRSDHNPLLLRCGGPPPPRGPRPFRFEAAWIDHNDYSKVVEDAWIEGNGSPIQGLQLVKEASISFSKEVFGNIFKRKRILENRLRGVQKSLERVDYVRLLLLEQQL